MSYGNQFNPIVEYDVPFYYNRFYNPVRRAVFDEITWTQTLKAGQTSFRFDRVGDGFKGMFLCRWEGVFENPQLVDLAGNGIGYRRLQYYNTIV